MLKKDKNGFLEIIKSHMIDHDLFKIYEEIKADHIAFYIQVNRSTLAFWTISPLDSYHSFNCDYNSFSPNYKNAGYIPESEWFSISKIYERFNQWLETHVKIYLEEQNTTDLWEVFMKDRVEPTITAISDQDDEHFTEEEQQSLSTKINELKVWLLEQYSSANAEQLADINKRLNSLDSAASKQSRFDWRTQLVGTVIGLIQTLSVDKSDGIAIFHMAKQLFSDGLMFLHNL